MQGTVIAGLKCSVSIDTIGKEGLQNTHSILYRYKNTTSIPPLGFIDDILAVSTCSTKSIETNAIIQAKIQGKRLELGQKKCFQMHVGNDSDSCPTLNIHSQKMLTTNSEKYLGQIISSTGKLENNINDRFNKGLGIVNEILGMLKEVSFGFHYFQIAMLFRNSKLVNGILFSIETLYGLTNAHIDKLEQCDRLLMRKVFNCVSSTAIEAFYLEANVLPFRHIIIARRLMFYWSILHKSESELVRKVFHTQKLSPVKNDWCVQIQSDLEQCGIALTELEISSMTRYRFKSLVRTKVNELARDHLTTLKSKHSKSVGLNCDFEKMQDYLLTDNLSTEEKQLLFKFRTQTYPCKANFRRLYEPDLSCPICPEEDRPEHLLNCTSTTQGIDTNSVQFSDIFGNLNQQTKIINVLKQIIVNRNLILQETPTLGSQVHPV